MKFVVVGAPRTGTTMFLAALNTLENFNTYSEPLATTHRNIKHPQESLQYFRLKDYKANTKIKEMGMNNFLNWIFSTGNHVGFKILYQHVNRFPNAVKYVNQNRVYKVHLIRRNQVKRVISGKLNKYHHYGIGTNKMNPKNILRDVKVSANWDNELFKTFGKNRYMKMYYEEFTGSGNISELNFTEVFDFLD